MKQNRVNIWASAALIGMAINFPVFAFSCPTSLVAGDHALKEGIGAQWEEGPVKWYLDYFSKGKPEEASVKKITFLQALFENNQLTCYYGWPSTEGSTTNWMTVRLKTTQQVEPKWSGDVCQNFMAENCQFDLKAPVQEPAAAPSSAPAGAPAGNAPSTPSAQPSTPDNTAPAANAPSAPSSAPSSSAPAGSTPAAPSSGGAGDLPLPKP